MLAIMAAAKSWPWRAFSSASTIAVAIAKSASVIAHVPALSSVLMSSEAAVKCSSSPRRDHLLCVLAHAVLLSAGSHPARPGPRPLWFRAQGVGGTGHHRARDSELCDP